MTSDLSRLGSRSLSCPSCAWSGLVETRFVIDVDARPEALEAPASLACDPCPTCGTGLESGVLLVRRRPGPCLVWALAGQAPNEDDLAVLVSQVVDQASGELEDTTALALPASLAFVVMARDPDALLTTPELTEAYGRFTTDWQERRLAALVEDFVSTSDWAAARQFVEEHPEIVSEGALDVLERLAAGHRRQVEMYEQHRERLRSAIITGLDEAFPSQTDLPSDISQVLGAIFDGQHVDVERAQTQFESALDYDGDVAAETAALLHLASGILAQRRSDLDGAQTHLGGALQLYHALRDRVGEANTERELGTLARHRGDLAASLAHLESALWLHQEIGNRLGEANTERELGTLARRRTDLRGAHAHAERARRLYRELDNRLGEANTERDLGLLAQAGGDLERAEAHIDCALRLYRELDDRLGEASAELERGILAQAVGDLDGAQLHLEQALRLHRDIENGPGEASAQLELGILAQLRGDLDRAQSHLEAALRLHRAAGNRVREADTERELGSLAVRRADLDDAQAHLERALGLHLAAGNRPGVANAELELGTLAGRRQDLDGAQAHLERALGLHRDAGDRLAEAVAERELGLLSVSRGTDEDAGDDHDRVLGHWREALAHVLRAVRLMESGWIFQATEGANEMVHRQARDISLMALQIAAVLGDGPAALEVAETARADAVARVLRRGNPTVGGEVGKLLATIRAMEREPDPARQATPNGAGAPRPWPRSRELEACYIELGQLTSGALAASWAPSPAASDPEAAPGLPDGIHALVYELDDTDPERPVAYVVWLAPDAEPVVESAVLDGPAAGLVSRYANRDDTGASEEDAEAYELTATALLPTGLRSLFAAQSARLDAGEQVEPIEVVLVPASRLWALPWAALRVGDRRLVELATLALAPSLRVQAGLGVGGGAQPERAALVCFGAAESAAGTSRQKLERQALAEVFPEAGTPPSELAARLSETSSSHVVVSAVHGLPAGDDEGLDHGVDLGDGVTLRAKDLLAARLAGSLTVGACWISSAITGPDTEPLGFPAVALCVGAQGVCGGILPLPDGATGLILADYYRRLVRGVAPHRALRGAQLSYLADHPQAPAAEWAGLVVTGHAAPGATGSRSAGSE